MTWRAYVDLLRSPYRGGCVQAFPNAKVLLTVRNIDDTVKDAMAMSPFSMPEYGNGVYMLMEMMYNVRSARKITKRRVAKKILEHNTKIIHGVPKDQLLVWDMYKQPSWDVLCAFLGEPVPAAPFPTPRSDEW